MKDRSAARWEALARRQPYFAVLTSDGEVGVESNARATSAFFETGEADVAALLATMASIFARQIPLVSALDFGCGAGRLTLPLARRAHKVVACDIAPTMLAHVRRNAASAGLSNIAFILSDALTGLPPESFDFVLSLLVLQYVPAARGYALIRTLLRLLAPGGVGALHLTLGDAGRGHRPLSPATRTRLRFIRRWIGDARRERIGLMESSAYDELLVLQALEEAGGHLVARLATDDGDMRGAVLIVEKGR
jgi:SAM-dependent methyltransferase